MTISFARKSEFIEGRRQGRAPISLAIVLRERGRRAMDARLVDFSAQGCQIDRQVVGQGLTQVWIKLPGLESLPAQRRWSDGSRAGFAFDALLHPAVAARFLPTPGSHAAAAVVTPFVMPDPRLSRREQIVAGNAGWDFSPLTRRKQPIGPGLAGLIKRTVSRTVDHRAERRHADAMPEATALELAGENVRVLNVSSSGIKVKGALAEREIGETIELAFAGFPALTGQLVWTNGHEAGITLPQAAIELCGRAAA